jgi:hypothetical protein
MILISEPVARMIVALLPRTISLPQQRRSSTVRVRITVVKVYDPCLATLQAAHLLDALRFIASFNLLESVMRQLLASFHNYDLTQLT